LRLRESKAAELLASRGAAFVSGYQPDRPPEGSEGLCSLMVTADPATHKILLLLSRRQVQSWGELAERQPRELAREYLEAGEPAEGFIGRELARRAGFAGADQSRVERLVAAAHRLFVELDCIWVEMGFVRTREGFFATRASVEMDEGAAFRHTELSGEFQPNCQLPRTGLERTARAAGIEYIELDGDLGLLPGGTGFGMAAVDVVRHVGGRPANVMDSGGEATPARIQAMMDILLDDPRILAVFCCRYAGLTRADGWARIMIQYILDKKPSKPIVLRLAGNAEEEARKLFEEASTQHPQEFSRVVVFHSNTPVDNAAREAVAMTDMLQKGEDPFAGASASQAEAHKGELPPNIPMAESKPIPAAPQNPRDGSRTGPGGAEGAAKGGG
jgi:succinyl-CoA synthetase beta subunit